MLFLLIEHFHDGDARPIYRRLRERGRMIVPGVTYVNSWVTSDLTRCYQVMDCEDRQQLDAWIQPWSDICRFEVVEVVTSAEAQARVAPDL